MKSDILAFDTSFIKDGNTVWLFDVEGRSGIEDKNAPAKIIKSITNYPDDVQFGRVLLVQYENGESDVISQAFVFETKEDLLYARSMHLACPKPTEDEKRDAACLCRWVKEVPEGYDELSWIGYNGRTQK